MLQTYSDIYEYKFRFTISWHSVSTGDSFYNSSIEQCVPQRFAKGMHTTLRVISKHMQQDPMCDSVIRSSHLSSSESLLQISHLAAHSNPA